MGEINIPESISLGQWSYSHVKFQCLLYFNINEMKYYVISAAVWLFSNKSFWITQILRPPFTRELIQPFRIVSVIGRVSAKGIKQPFWFILSRIKTSGEIFSPALDWSSCAVSSWRKTPSYPQWPGPIGRFWWGTARLMLGGLQPCLRGWNAGCSVSTLAARQAPLVKFQSTRARMTCNGVRNHKEVQVRV